jgi:hypothetical protein
MTHQIYTCFNPSPFRASKGKFTQAHVDRLKAMLDKHVSVPFEFHVRESWYPGWWGKIPILSEAKAFYMDLSVAIVGNIDHMLEDTGKFCVCRDFMKPDHINTKIMSWNQETHYNPGLYRIVNGFSVNPNRIMDEYQSWPSKWGDQGYVEFQNPERRYFQDVWPGQILSYKEDVGQVGKKELAEKYPECRILAFHGNPRPEDTEYWNI